MAKRSDVRNLCRLCLMLRPKEEIRKSHIIPAFCFRQQQRRVGGPSVLVTQKGIVQRSTQQFPEYLLCDRCEGRMKAGEDYFRSICYDDGGACPLFKMAGHRSSVTSLDQKSEPRFIDVPALDADRLEYFAASVFWRAAVAQDRTYEMDVPQRERWRTYLIGQTGFPRNAGIQTVVLDQARDFSDSDPNFLDLIDFPWVADKPRVPWKHTRSTFSACGVTFRLFWITAKNVVFRLQRRQTVAFSHPLDLDELKGRWSLINEREASPV